MKRIFNNEDNRSPGVRGGGFYIIGPSNPRSPGPSPRGESRCLRWSFSAPVAEVSAVPARRVVELAAFKLNCLPCVRVGSAPVRTLKPERGGSGSSVAAYDGLHRSSPLQVLTIAPSRSKSTFVQICRAPVADGDAPRGATSEYISGLQLRAGSSDMSAVGRLSFF